MNKRKFRKSDIKVLVILSILTIISIVICVACGGNGTLGIISGIGAIFWIYIIASFGIPCLLHPEKYDSQYIADIHMYGTSDEEEIEAMKKLERMSEMVSDPNFNLEKETEKSLHDEKFMNDYFKKLDKKLRN